MGINEGQIEHFGIDFGTTNIAIGGLIVDKDTKKAFRVLYGEDGVPFPSLLAVNSEYKVQFGRKVKNQIASLQDNGYRIFKSIKSSLGSEDKYTVGIRELSATQIVTGLIKTIKKYLEQGQRQICIKEATIAVPVDFDFQQRKELCAAFKSAGITVNKIVSESMAAYIRNRDDVAGLSEVMVFDWGGGTLDISLLRVEKGKVYEEATSGWKVAGDKIDEDIAEFVHNRLVNNVNYSIKVPFSELSAKDRAKLLAECERAKITFSDEDEIDSPVIISMMDYCGEKRVYYKLSYDEFSEKINSIVCEAVGLIGNVLGRANKTLIDLNAIIMVGGSSNLLPLRNIVDKQIGQNHKIKIIYPTKPQWSVAEGAAVIDSVNCQYQINQDISIVMSDGTKHPIIQCGSKIPFDGEPISFGTVDNATSANFILSDNKDNVLGQVSMPAKGFLGEYFSVKGSIDNSLVALISISGNRMMSSVGEKRSEIKQLSYYCDISDIENYEFEIKE